MPNSSQVWPHHAGALELRTRRSQGEPGSHTREMHGHVSWPHAQITQAQGFTHTCPHAHAQACSCMPRSLVHALVSCACPGRQPGHPGIHPHCRCEEACLSSHSSCLFKPFKSALQKTGLFFSNFSECSPASQIGNCMLPMSKDTTHNDHIPHPGPAFNSSVSKSPTPAQISKDTTHQD